MANEQQLEFEFVVDDSGIKKAFNDVQKEAKNTSKKANDAFGAGDIFGTEKAFDLKNALGDVGDKVGELAGRFGKLGIAVGAVAASGVLLKEAFDLALEGEKLQQIQKSFDAIAMQVGVDSGEIRAGLEKASGGVADFDEVIKTAGIALAEFGDQADKLPQLLEVARAASLRFGGTVEDRFQQLVQSVSSGTTKSLRDIALFVDAGKEVEKFARANNVAADAISEAGKRQVILNAILRDSKTAYAGINLEADNLASASGRMKEAFKEAGDSIKESFAENLGPGFITAMNFISSLFAKQAEEIEKPKSAAAELADQMKATQESLLSLTQEMAVAANGGGVFADKGFNRPARDAQTLQAEIDKTVLKLDELGKKQQELASAPQKKKEGVFDEAKLAEERLKREEDFQKRLRDIRQSSDDLEFQRRALGSTFEEQAAVKSEQILTQSETKKAQILQDFSAKKRFTEEQRNALLQAETERANREIELIEEQSLAKRLEQQNQKLKVQVDSYKSIISNGLGSAFEEVGRRLQQGEGLFDDFGNSIVAIFGDLLIQSGKALILEGLAIEAFVEAINTLLPGSGLVAAAAGAGLVVFGSLLKASVGKGGSNGSVQTGGGSATPDTTNPGSVTQPVAPEDTTVQTPKTELRVEVHGNVLGTSDRSLALAITDILNDQFSSTGLVLKT